MTLAAHGSTLRVHGDPDLVHVVLAQLPEHYVPDTGEPAVELVVKRSGSGVRVVLDDEELLDSPDQPHALRAATSRLEHAVISRVLDLAVVHAGAVTWGSGAILLPATSMSGKSTLTRALVEAGAAYLSDEYALLDADGVCHPYVRPLTIRTPGGSTRVPPETLGAVAEGPVPVRTVALLRYDAGASGLTVTRLTPGAGTLGLLENCVNGRTAPVVVLDALAAVANQAEAYEGTRGDVADAVAWLRVIAGA